MSLIFIDILIYTDPFLLKMDKWTELSSLLEKREAFCFIKINDGEMKSILDSNDSISRGAQTANKELGKHLTKALNHFQERYYVGIPCQTCYPDFHKICKTIRNGQDYYANLFINSNFEKSFNLFSKLFVDRRIVFVCSENADISSLPFSPYIILKTPNSNSWDAYTQYKNGYTMCNDNDIVLFCCGPLGRVLACKWFKNNPTLTCIELGSFYDPWTQNKAYMYHTSILPYCKTCNDNDYNGINEETLNKCFHIEKYYWSDPNPDFLKNIYNNNIEKVKYVYDVISRNADPGLQYYAKWKKLSLTELTQEEIEKTIEEYLEKYPTRVEIPYELLKRFLNKKDQIKWLWKLIDIKLSDERFICSDLYNWKILDDIVIDCYYQHQYEDSYKAWLLNMKKKQFPKHLEFHCTDNGRYAKLVLDSKLTYNNFIQELEKIENDNTVIDEIPKIFHFIYIAGNHPYVLSHYLAIKSCYTVQSPDKIYMFHGAVTDELKENIWWNKTKEIATFIQINIPMYINNKSITYPQHQADIMRIHILKKFGGVYMDIDVLSVKRLECDQDVLPDFVSSKCTENNLYKHSLVMCEETKAKLCNCVIMARPNHPLINLWIQEYEDKYGDVEDHWAGLSVMKPYELVRENPNLDTTILQTHNFLPFTFHETWFFTNGQEQIERLNKSLLIHLWDTESMKKGVIPVDTQYFEKYSDSLYTKLFQKYINME